MNANWAGSGYLPIDVHYFTGVQYTGQNAHLLMPVAGVLNTVQPTNVQGAQYTGLNASLVNPTIVGPNAVQQTNVPVGYQMMSAEYSMATAQMGGVRQPMQLICNASQANALNSRPPLGAVSSLHSFGTPLYV